VKDLDKCSAGGRWLSLFLQFEDAIKCGRLNGLLSAMACILDAVGKFQEDVFTL